MSNLFEVMKRDVIDEPARLVDNFVIPKKSGKAFVVKKGQTLRIIENEGKQVGDVALWNANDYKEYWHAGYTMTLNCLLGSGNFRAVKYLFSKAPRENVMFTVTQDTIKSHQMTFGSRCSQLIRQLRKDPESNCQEILTRAIEPYGLTGDDIHDAFVVFQNIELVGDCRRILAPASEKGDYIDLRAEMDNLVAISCCPSDKTSITNAYKAKSLKVEIYE